MILSFSHFHPVKGLPPETEHFLGADIVLRARAILAARKLKEIREGIKIVNWLIAQSPANQLALKQLTREAAATNRKGRNKNQATPMYRDFGTDIYSLNLCMGKFDISGHDGFPRATWPELFAVLALALINEAVDNELHYGKLSGNKELPYLREYRKLSHVSPWLTYAASAVATAEALMLCKKAGKGKKKKPGLRSEASAIETHHKTILAVKALDNYYCSGEFKSLRSAAKMFIEDHPDKVAHLAPTSRLKTLSEGLSRQLTKRGAGK